MAEFLDGMPRYPKMHPCGLVLSRQPLHELTPTFIANKGYATTHFDMDAVEAIGLVKMDILAQGGLAVMRDVKQSLAAKGIHIDLPGENGPLPEPFFSLSSSSSIHFQALHEPGRADLPVGLDAQQRVPTVFRVPMRDFAVVEASPNPGRIPRSGR